ncbi:riboflavin biosynthesis protein RibD [Ruminiclostridium papyrosolvens DSM 2782]|uniref:Riboflavin biosynthesis protein RibD n=1 Tax=Ruminiclostridium papyrosolvens DSM 2782 TaxID=588581 RepID=F1TAB0_9FIRM|nr:bifunctional diaminohydroxyphosphoribosylaminopyrimidine deaminase/5-amino-6-(5-phosphoribosylamino)uracil reductase RibD [Ruminiclostridium papyrosolvens]EGD48453.1 riboflavin biosynthesis protein RibD [Ruminiclostridium papyrosolvens DSM 2782]WES32789.1 bifunctional diaminohydroxyphosphoribosylaminopyrimidine deaminase/5-amino-6-(5-phosphoribosylamino)uracil reductase RibD [Ruminiclostridium papyrosolvens DSM 2782]
MNIHEFYMKRAFEISKGGWGRTNPNPLVGAVIVKDGEIISEGFHEALGGAHAEVCAFQNATSDISGATIYVNLEPCSHYGRTPPCAKAIAESGIKEVVVAMVDPNPKVSGKGIQILKDANINVIVGVLEEEARRLNEIFIHYITKQLPFVIMKTAMTLDGKIASVTGDSRWISSEPSREYVHKIRNRVSSIMVGVNTIIKDNPSLTARPSSGDGIDPVRIVVDSRGRIPMDSRVINGDSNAGLILATTDRINKDKETQLLSRGVRIIKTIEKSGKVNLGELMRELYKLEIDSVLLEGGGNLNFSALEAGIVNKVMTFVSPKIIGGSSAVTPVGGEGIEEMKDAIALSDIRVEGFDRDVLIEGYIADE